MASILKAASGLWSDRAKRRKPFVVAGYGLSALAKPLFSVAGSWGQVLAIRIAERTGKGLRDAPRDALVAESVDEQVRGKAFGYHRAMDGAGSFLGALAAFLLLPGLGYRRLFLVAAVPGALAVLVTLLVRERRGVHHEGVRDAGSSRIGFRDLPGNLRLYIVAASIFALGHFGYPFMLLRAKDVGLTDPGAILFYVVFYGVYTLVSIPAGSHSDRIGRKRMLLFCYPFFGVIALLLWMSAAAWSVLVCFVLYGIFQGMMDGVQRAFVADLAPARLRATALGAFHAAIGIASLPGGLAAGVLWQRIGPGATFLYGALLSAAALGILMGVRRSSGESPRPGCF